MELSPEDVKMSKPDGLEFNTPYTIEELSQKEISRELDKNDEEPKEELYNQKKMKKEWTL